MTLMDGMDVGMTGASCYADSERQCQVYMLITCLPLAAVTCVDTQLNDRTRVAAR